MTSGGGHPLVPKVSSPVTSCMSEERPNQKKVKREEQEIVSDVTVQEVVPDALINSSSDAKATFNATVEARRHEVRHEVALPSQMASSYVPLGEWEPPLPPAREYAFTLDPFQHLATRCIDRGESVLVSAHTSAGKTVCAEYAIATALRDHQRVIYTSPIKALSNQKYRELQEIFGDVGLMTGDVTINPTASCLVMTTEILRSMLYRGSEVMREVSWVVFDEIHYMRDKERGVVWEETIILLPDSVHFVFLSATIPNALQFARWIAHIHSQPCHVVYTNYRPTPLQHYLYPAGGDGIHLVVDELGNFREQNFQRALNIFGSKEGGSGSGNESILSNNANSSRRRANAAASNKNAPAGTSDLFRLIKMIFGKNLYPAIVFSFSKRECESNAMQMSKLDFNSEEEKTLVKDVFNNALESLSPADRQLPQIESILPLLQRGIGIHHSGLLPILKEVIEILFQEGLLKLLFATETFSIGLNMPAKTVIFTSVRKFDGRDFRPVSSGEYIQMSGRAGRRGLDDRGIVIMMLDDKLEPSVCKEMIKGQADCLNSAFHLSYNMILNLMRVDGMSPDHILQRSFYQFQNGDSLPQLEAEVVVAEGELSAHLQGISQDDRVMVADFWEIRSQLDDLRSKFRKIVHHPSFSLPFLQSGRLVRIRVDGRGDFGWAVILSVKKIGGSNPTTTTNTTPQEANTAAGVTTIAHVLNSASPRYVIEVVGRIANGSTPADPQPASSTSSADSKPAVFTVDLGVLDGMSAVRLHLPKDVKTASDAQAVVVKSINEVERRFPDGLPLLHPVNDLAIGDPAFGELVDRMEALERTLLKHPLRSLANYDHLLSFQTITVRLEEACQQLKDRITRAHSVLHMDELHSRKRLLRRLTYTRPEDIDVIDVKGRVACEISTGDELLLTELIFSAAFKDLAVEQINALLSCFVFQEKSGNSGDDKKGGGELRLKEELAGPWRIIQEAARRIYQVSTESGLTIAPSESDYLNQLRPELMEVVLAWSRGAPFAKICRMTDVFEGSIIRAMRRLDELLRQLGQAAKSIGNAELESKFTGGMERIHRDIVFANSLYL